MTPEELSAVIAGALRAAVSQGALALSEDQVPDAPHVERPRQREHGDWATNVALQLAKAAGSNPRAVATDLADRLRQTPGIAKVDVAGPGFLNITVESAAAGQAAQVIVQAGAEYGRDQALAGTTVNLEFVSANPTGPIHIGGTRWAAVGDSMARIFEARGAKVIREYYFNDHGAQIDRFANSLLHAARGWDAPEDGYGGAYIHEIAAEVRQNEQAAGRPDPVTLEDAEAQELFRARGVELMFTEIKQELEEFGVVFDVYYHEDSLHTSGAVAAALEELKTSGALYLADGAWWLRSTQFGDDKDRVVIKSDGNAAYIAGDIAYFRDKRQRGADLCIYLLGADHHGYVARLKAAAAALGDDPDRVEVVIGQLVNLVRDGAPMRMSKRAGTVVTINDLVDAVGVDAARYSLTRSSADSSIDIDLDLLSKATNENPVYYVQYAHARTCAVGRNAEQFGVRRGDGFDPGALTHDTESALLGVLAQFPRIVAQAADLREPHRVARYLEDLAGTYHRWYGECRVTPLGEEPVTDLHRTRLWLNDATRQVLANGMNLLGVTAPERM